MDMEKISAVRKEIDAIDAQLVELINRRFKSVLEIGELKRQSASPVYVPERESMLMDKLEKLNSGPMRRETLYAVYREIMSGARLLEGGTVVAYLGPAGTYSEQAAKLAFGHGAELVPVASIAEIFAEVESGRATYGCVPFENTLAGVVDPAMDSLLDSGLKIIREFDLEIHHQLLSRCRLEEIECVYSHSQALGQCRRFLHSRLPQARQVETASTVQAAEMALKNEKSAAVAGVAASELYDIPVLVPNIEDAAGNATRFVIVGKQDTAPSGNDKTSVCFTLHNEAGALCDALAVFRNAGISLSLITSRPFRKGSEDYCFFVNMEGHLSTDKVRSACEELAKKAVYFKVVGSYPRKK